MINRVSAAVFATVLSFGAPAAVLGQTVADYRDAVAAVPIPDAPADVVDAHCRAVTNYVYTSLAPWEETRDWLLGALPIGRTADETLAAKRTRCLQLREQPLIAFDGGSGAQIVDPPSLEDPDAAYRIDPTALPPAALPPRTR